MENEQKRANDLELEVQNLTSIIQQQEEANNQLQSELQSQRQLIEDQNLSMKTQHDQMKQEIEREMKRQMGTLLGALSFSNSNVPLNTVSFVKLFHYYVYNYILHF